MDPCMFSSEHNEWQTPKALFDALDREFHFETDVCATPSNAMCAKFYTKEQDGLKQEWVGSCFMNPPYGREILKWMEKAYKSALGGGAVVVCLVPARTDTRWWQQYAMQATEIRFISGRVKFGFGDSAGSAPFPSAVVIFGTPRTPVIRSWGVPE